MIQEQDSANSENPTPHQKSLWQKVRDHLSSVPPEKPPKKSDEILPYAMTRRESFRPIAALGAALGLGAAAGGIIVGRRAVDAEQMKSEPINPRVEMLKNLTQGIPFEEPMEVELAYGIGTVDNPKGRGVKHISFRKDIDAGASITNESEYNQEKYRVLLTDPNFTHVDREKREALLELPEAFQKMNQEANRTEARPDIYRLENMSIGLNPFALKEFISSNLELSAAYSQFRDAAKTIIHKEITRGLDLLGQQPSLTVNYDLDTISRQLEDYELTDGKLAVSTTFQTNRSGSMNFTFNWMGSRWDTAKDTFAVVLEGWLDSLQPFLIAYVPNFPIDNERISSELNEAWQRFRPLVELALMETIATNNPAATPDERV